MHLPPTVLVHHILFFLHGPFFHGVHPACWINKFWQKTTVDWLQQRAPFPQEYCLFQQIIDTQNTIQKLINNRGMNHLIVENNICAAEPSLLEPYKTNRTVILQLDQRGIAFHTPWGVIFSHYKQAAFFKNPSYGNPQNTLMSLATALPQLIGGYEKVIEHSSSCKTTERFDDNSNIAMTTSGTKKKPDDKHELVYCLSSPQGIIPEQPLKYHNLNKNDPLYQLTINLFRRLQKKFIEL